MEDHLIPRRRNGSNSAENKEKRRGEHGEEQPKVTYKMISTWRTKGREEPKMWCVRVCMRRWRLSVRTENRR